MPIARSVSEVLRDHVTLETEAIDRMYLNVYVPGLQHVGGVVWYLRQPRGQCFASTATVAPMSEAFVARITAFIAEEPARRGRQGKSDSSGRACNSRSGSALSG